MYNLFLSNYDKFVIKCTFVAEISILIRFFLQLIGQHWIRTTAHTSTLVLTPIITIITNVISGNIALSIGMVGALSIVRFRNPVKNPFELVMYFALLTLGITLGLNGYFGQLHLR